MRRSSFAGRPIDYPWLARRSTYCAVREGAPELTVRGDPELREDLAQVPLTVRALIVELAADLGVRAPVVPYTAFPFVHRSST